MSRLTKYPLISLTFISILCGLLWRIEVENHGWTGLNWLTYFHIAVPLGFGLFLLWTNLFIQTSGKNRIILNLMTAIFGLIIYILLEVSLTYIFAQGPTGFIYLMSTPSWKFNLFRYSIFVIVPLIPIGAFFILNLFGQKVKVKFLLLSIFCIIISVPLSTSLLQLMNHKGGHDYIHAIKSGIIIPLWAISVGLLIVGLKYSTIDYGHEDELFDGIKSTNA